MLATQSLNRYDLERLSVGAVAGGDICDKHGRLLVRHGTDITDDLLDLIHRRCSLTFYSPHEWPDNEPKPSYDLPDRDAPIDEAAVADAALTLDEEIEAAADEDSLAPETNSKTVAVESLRAGMRIAYSIWDDRGVLLLASNSTVTPRFLQLLKNRNLQRVTVRRRALDTLPRSVRVEDNVLTRRMDDLLEPLSRRGASPGGAPWSQRGHLSHADLRDRTIKNVALYRERISDLQNNAGGLLEGRSGQMRQTRGMMDVFVESIELDQDIIPCILALRESPHEYLYDHAMNVSLLGMAMATHLGYARGDVMQIGLAGLLNDLGMLEVDPDIRLAPRPLEQAESLAVKRHPIHTVEILGRNRGVDPMVLFVAYQTHERCDGSGYPRGRTVEYIHPFARIISVADVYCAMTSKRPYRNALKPYDAVAAILGEAVFGSYDTVALRALIDCISLYPVGSTVKLNDGQRARVFRSSPGQYDRPVLSMQRVDRSETGELIDLREHPNLRVVRILG